MCPCESPFLDKDLIALVEQFPGHSLPWLSQEAINQVKYLVSQGKLCVRYCGRSPHYHTPEQITTKQDPNEVPTFLPVLQSDGTLVVGVSGMDTKIHIFLDPTNNNIGVRVEDEWRWIVRGTDLDEMQEKMEHQHDQLRQSAERIEELEFGCNAKQKRIEDLESDFQDAVLSWQRRIDKLVRECVKLRDLVRGYEEREHDLLQIGEVLDKTIAVKDGRIGALKANIDDMWDEFFSANHRRMQTADQTSTRISKLEEANKKMLQVLSQVSEEAARWKLARQKGTYTPPDPDYSAMDCVYQTLEDARHKEAFT